MRDLRGVRKGMSEGAEGRAKEKDEEENARLCHGTAVLGGGGGLSRGWKRANDGERESGG